MMEFKLENFYEASTVSSSFARPTKQSFNLNKDFDTVILRGGLQVLKDLQRFSVPISSKIDGETKKYNLKKVLEDLKTSDKTCEAYTPVILQALKDALGLSDTEAKALMLLKHLVMPDDGKTNSEGTPMCMLQGGMLFLPKLFIQIDIISIINQDEEKGKFINNEVMKIKFERVNDHKFRLEGVCVYRDTEAGDKLTFTNVLDIYYVNGRLNVVPQTLRVKYKYSKKNQALIEFLKQKGAVPEVVQSSSGQDDGGPSQDEVVGPASHKLLGKMDYKFLMPWALITAGGLGMAVTLTKASVVVAGFALPPLGLAIAGLSVLALVVYVIDKAIGQPLARHFGSGHSQLEQSSASRINVANAEHAPSAPTVMENSSESSELGGEVAGRPANDDNTALLKDEKGSTRKP